MVLRVIFLTLFSFMGVKSEQLNVVGPEAPLVAVAGQDLVLPCSIKPSTNAVDMTVEWFKQDSENSLVHLYKNHKDTNEKQAQSYRGRTSIFKEELLKGNVSLKLSALQVSDEGNYKCLIDDKTWSKGISVHVTVEVLGSHPVITVESYDKGGIHLVCESTGWKPKPEVLWLDREGAILPAEKTQIHNVTEGFSVKSCITVYDYSDYSRFYCRLQQKHHMMETDVIINSKVFHAWKKIVCSSVLAGLFAAGLIVAAVICYKKEQQRQRLENELQQVKQNAALELEKAEFKKTKKFAVDVTLDPDTVSPHLSLSVNGKEVKLGGTENELSDTTNRFNIHCVLGKESFSSGRFYYEVQVSGKTEWTLGVVKETIERKNWIKRCPEKGFWTVGLRNGSQYKVNADPDVPLTLREKVETVGVFVDYEEGLVSFYAVESSSHIYSFTGQSFTEKLYPYFSPRYNEDGKNSAPLIISDVKR